MAKKLGRSKLKTRQDIDTSAYERKRMILIRAKEIERQGPSLMTQAEAVAIAKREMTGNLDAKAKTAKRGELQHVRLTIRPAKGIGGHAPFVVSYAEADGNGFIKRYDRNEYWEQAPALQDAKRRENLSKTPIVIDRRSN
jgi:hypothetical protein